MMDYFQKSAESKQYTTINMTPSFIKDYEKNGKRFEYERDGHWNGYGHRLAATELLKVIK